jgi:hypothetical protein
VKSKARALALARNKARLERRRDIVREIERARTMTPQERLETALDLIDSLMELKEAAENAEDA